MILLFWGILFGLTLIALAFILTPLLRNTFVDNKDSVHDKKYFKKLGVMPAQTGLQKNSAKNLDTSLRQQNTALSLYQEHLMQLEQGLLTAQQYQENQRELQLSLLHDQPTSKSAENATTPISSVSSSPSTVLLAKRGWLTAWWFALALPLAALAFYHDSTSYQQFTHWLTSKQQFTAVQKLRGELGTPQQVIAKLKQHLQQDPQSAQGWYLLGRLYTSQQQFQEATMAFAHAYALQPKNPDIIFQYAQILYLTQHSLAGKPTTLLQQLLQLEPNNDLAVNLLAVAAYQQHDYQHAITLWERLLPNYPVNSPDGKALLNAIAQAQKDANHKSPTKPEAMLKIKNFLHE